MERPYSEKTPVGIYITVWNPYLCEVLSPGGYMRKSVVGDLARRNFYKTDAITVSSRNPAATSGHTHTTHFIAPVSTVLGSHGKIKKQ